MSTTALGAELDQLQRDHQAQRGVIDGEQTMAVPQPNPPERVEGTDQMVEQSDKRREFELLSRL